MHFETQDFTHKKNCFFKLFLALTFYNDVNMDLEFDWLRDCSYQQTENKTIRLFLLLLSTCFVRFVRLIYCLEPYLFRQNEIQSKFLSSKVKCKQQNHKGKADEHSSKGINVGKFTISAIDMFNWPQYTVSRT